MAIAHAQAKESNGFTQKDFQTIPHEKFPYIYPDVGFGKVQILAETDKGTKVVVVSGEGKGKITTVHQDSGGFLTAEIKEVPLQNNLDSQMTFIYRRLRSITKEKVSELLKNEREVEVLMNNLLTPQELVAFYADHICRDFSVRVAVFEANDINEKLSIIGKSLVH